MVQTDWDTSSNKQAQAGIESADGSGDERGEEEKFLDILRRAKTQADTHMSANLRKRWSNAYRAFQNQHYLDSKYLTPRYRGRSHLFRPKTRAGVRKNDATSAAALFSTAEVVNVSPENEEDKNQTASAIINQELLNYRLDRSHDNNGIPWFITAIGARQDAQLTGLCCSKQYWEYRERVDEWTEVEAVDEETGETVVELAPNISVERDRPMIRLFPMECVLRDPAADWTDQAQESGYLVLMHPMQVGEVRAMMGEERDKIGAQRWRTVDEQTLRQHVSQPEVQAVRRAREGTGQDRLDDNRSQLADFEIAWIYECFVRQDGKDRHFWSVGTKDLLTDIREVREVYPEQGGRRPVTIGYGTLEAHKVDPMSLVESWSPLQQEANDLVNLRLDNVKQNMSPMAKVRRGRNVDIKQVQNRTPDSVLYLQDADDVQWDRPPDVSASAYAEMDRINADFDDVAGLFTGSSVQTNRKLNETVGGMQLLNQSANTVGEFDLRVWVETWVEPTLRQLIKLEQYYENDPTILALVGKRAKLYERFGVDEITDELLTQSVTCRVDVGIGAADPMQRLQKFQMAAGIIGDVLGEKIQARVKDDEVITEVMGAAGYKDGMRFFRPAEDEDPRIQELTQMVQQLQKELEDKQADRDADLQKERIKAAARLAEQQIENRAKAAEGEGEVEADAMRFMEKLLGGGGASSGGGAGNIDLSPLTSMFGQMSEQQRASSQASSMMMAQTMRSVEDLARSVGDMARSASAPKRLVRDEQGRPAGVVPITGE